MGIFQSVHDKQASGSLNDVNFSAAQAASDLLNKAGVAQFVRLELRIAARGLPRKDKLSKSDPLAVVYTSLATGTTEWKEAGRTDVVANTADPQFVRPVLVRYTAAAAQPMRIVLYDADRLGRPERLSLSSQDYIGEAEFALADVMAAPARSLELPLLDLQAGRQLPPTCVAVIKAEQLALGDDRVVRLALSGSGLAKKDLASQSDPFLRVLKLRQGTEDDWVPVCKTEVRDNNPDPVWMPLEVDIRQLCSAEEQRPLKLQVFDFKTSGSHVLIGETTTSLAALLQLAAGPADQRSLELTAPPSSKKGGNGTAKPCVVTVRQAVVRPPPTLQQHMGGCWGACLAQA
ncbi:hypothetical protein ABPG75_008674 [Micractinium tetrahymenae]